MERIKDVYLGKFKRWSLVERVIVDKLDEIVDWINEHDKAGGEHDPK